MSSLKERIELLESDLKAVPPRISVYHDLPFAILRYDPAEEWELRREVKLLATRLEAVGQGGPPDPDVGVPLAGDRRDRGAGGGRRTGAGAGLPRRPGSGHDLPFRPGSGDRWRRCWPSGSRGSTRPKAVVFLTRVAAMAPGIYHMSKLLDQMHGKTRVTTILFYPGSIEGTTGLRFMDLKDREALGNYRVKIYG